MAMSAEHRFKICSLEWKILERDEKKDHRNEVVISLIISKRKDKTKINDLSLRTNDLTTRQKVENTTNTTR